MNAHAKRAEHNEFIARVAVMADEYASKASQDIALLPPGLTSCMYMFTPPQVLYNMPCYPTFRVLFSMVVTILRQKYGFHVQWSIKHPLRANISWVKHYKLAVPANKEPEEVEIPHVLKEVDAQIAVTAAKQICEDTPRISLKTNGLNLDAFLRK